MNHRAHSIPHPRIFVVLRLFVTSCYVVGGELAKIKMPPRGCRVGRDSFRTGKVGTHTVAARFMRGLFPTRYLLVTLDALHNYPIVRRGVNTLIHPT
jgi:hypothetical protein